VKTGKGVFLFFYLITRYLKGGNVNRDGRKLFFIAVFLAVAVFMQSPASGARLEEKVKEFELDNGMKFLVVNRDEAPVMFGAIVMDVGSANEWPNVTGISHLLEHMMFKGTKMMGTENYEAEIPYIEKTDSLGERSIKLRKEIGEWRFKIFEDFSKDIVSGFSVEEAGEAGTDKSSQNSLVVKKIKAMKTLPDSIAERDYLLEDDGTDYLGIYLEYKTAWAELYRLLEEQREKYIVNNELWETYQNNGVRFLNAGTSYDFTVYFAYLPANRLELWMTAESDRMDEPVFREFWTERDVVMEERRLGENDPDDVMRESFYAAAFKACPYKWPVVGWMSDLRTIDRKELAEYHKKYYSPNNATAVIVGDVDLKQVKKMAVKYFEPIPAQPPVPPIETREPEQQGEVRIEIEHSANPKLMIGYHKPNYPDPRGLAFQVMADILGAGKTSRLYKSVYEEQELTADAPRVYIGPSERYDNMLVISAAPRHPHTLEEVEEAIYAELDKLKEELVTERELQRVKNKTNASMVRSMGSNLGIGFQLLTGEIYYGDYTGMFEMIEKLKKVGAEEIRAAAGEFLKKKNRVVARRVQVKEDEDKSGDEEMSPMKKYQKDVMRYIKSLPRQEQMEIGKKFQSMRSRKEMMEFGKELFERAKAAGYIKEEGE